MTRGAEGLRNQNCKRGRMLTRKETSNCFRSVSGLRGAVVHALPPSLIGSRSPHRFSIPERTVMSSSLILKHRGGGRAAVGTRTDNNNWTAAARPAPETALLGIRFQLGLLGQTKGSYVVARIFFLLLLNCSAWPCLDPA